MTADESGLPPLDPEDINVSEFQPAGKIVAWVIETLLEMGVSDDRRQALVQVFNDIEFQPIAVRLRQELIQNIENEGRKAEEILPSDEELQAMQRRIEERKRSRDIDPENPHSSENDHDEGERSE